MRLLALKPLATSSRLFDSAACAAPTRVGRTPLSDQPQSGGRMQPRALALGKGQELESPRGAKDQA